MTLVDDGCATYSEQRHREALLGMKGYCRVRTSDALLAELSELES